MPKPRIRLQPCDCGSRKIKVRQGAFYGWHRSRIIKCNDCGRSVVGTSYRKAKKKWHGRKTHMRLW